ncbi:MAG TPA: hypothetical protein VF868_13025 [Bacteroidia bacterium]|jgi:antitoxin component YwqK of YwqJK toxin-antitoxin module
MAEKNLVIDLKFKTMTHIKYCFLICFLNTSFIYAQNDTIRKTFYPNGNPSELSVKVDEKYEKTIYYHESGGILSEGLKKDQFKVGSWKHYYESGKLKAVGSFKRSYNPEKCFKKYPNPKHGKWIYYSEQGSIILKVWYKNGHTKKLIKYDENHKVIERYRNHWWNKWDHDSLSPI